MAETMTEKRNEMELSCDIARFRAILRVVELTGKQRDWYVEKLAQAEDELDWLIHCGK